MELELSPGLAVEDLVEADTAHLGNGIGIAQLGEGLEGGLHHAVGVGGAFRLSQHVLHADAFEHCTHSTTGDNTGTGSCGFHENEGAAIFAFLSVRDGTVEHGNLNEVLLGIINALSDGGGDFLGFTEAVAHDAILVAYHHDSGKAECSTTLGNFSYSVNCNQSVFEFDIG